MQLNGEVFILSTGKEIGANRNIIGINPELEIYEGYDGQLDQPAYNHKKDCMEPPLTAEEAMELSHFMIQLWREFAEKYSTASL